MNGLGKIEYADLKLWDGRRCFQVVLKTNVGSVAEAIPANEEGLHRIFDAMAAAKVSTLKELTGIPVEVEFIGNRLSEWRVLTEVI